MRVLSGLAVVLALAAGCSSNAPEQQPQQQPSGSAAAAQAQTKDEQDQAKVQNLTADCMKAQGFTYIPRPVTHIDANRSTAGVGDPSQAPYEDLKKYREKYGYGVYGRDVFPDDPAVGNTPIPPDPNEPIRNGLDPARRDAYDKALNGDVQSLKANAGKKPTGPVDLGCVGKAAEQVYPPRPEQKPDPAKEAEYQKVKQKFDTDPQLLSAAAAYGSCLRQKGFQVPSTKPGVVESTVQQAILKERTDLGDKIDPARAQQGLQDEIRKSLDDLECGKDYLKVEKPLMAALLAAPGGNG
ncbi:hypothetical protein [Actinocrispum sp. NPDC049592]|uniref:hypothetical protein n=1 Tax=Actinocrispum sp. NPDC049592 TaxID=3154835 RepID=UPI003430393E